MNKRRHSQMVTVGSVKVGGEAPVVVQGMTKTDTRNVEDVCAEIDELVSAGCELVRIAVFDADAVAALEKIRARVNVPLIADVHFDHKLALGAIDAGVHKLRLNPGNIKKPEYVHQIAKKAEANNVAIRVGANAGSLPRDIVDEHGGPTASALAQACLRQIRLLEQAGCSKIIASCKAFEPDVVLAAYKELAQSTSWPFHVGITEAGPPPDGIIRSTAGITLLLAEGLCDTIRVSLTAPAVEEIKVARSILQTLGERKFGPEIVSCPTCGRCRIDLKEIAVKVADRVQDITEPIRIAVMGCPVNGPGEAKMADIGIAAGTNDAVLFCRGKVIRRVDPEYMVDVLMEEISALVDNENK